MMNKIILWKILYIEIDGAVISIHNKFKNVVNKGPIMEPSGTPVWLSLKSVSLTLYLIYCFLFDM